MIKKVRNVIQSDFQNGRFFLSALSEISAETVRFVFQSRVLADPV